MNGNEWTVIGISMSRAQKVKAITMIDFLNDQIGTNNSAIDNEISNDNTMNVTRPDPPIVMSNSKQFAIHDSVFNA